MDFTVYRQAVKERNDGTKVYKGEDTLPYVGDKLFFVADGLGGAAAIRHQSIRKELFDEDKIVDVLFEGVFSNTGNETFLNYVKKSFFELYAVKDCYTDNINNIKKSGYFASRIVSAIVLNEFLCNEEMDIDNIFIKYSECSDDTKIQSLNELGVYFRDIIKDKLRCTAKNGNIVYESSYSGLSLLGTTLCATIINEDNESVKAIYLTAGDSRPYYWSKEGGLCQLLKDQEGADGGMTNYIKANENGDFDIRCDYFEFNKPCILFNASDGCFDSSSFLSQMAYEILILQSIKDSDDIQQVKDKITEYFFENGKHDDSSTMAVKIFGYNDYESLKIDAIDRLNQIDDEYINAFPELLEIDFETELREYKQNHPDDVDSLKDDFENNKKVKEYCFEALKKNHYKYFNMGLDKLNIDLNNNRRLFNDNKMKLKVKVSENYVKFPKCNDSKGYWERNKEKSKISAILKLEDEIKDKETEYRNGLNSLIKEFRNGFTCVDEILNRIIEIDIPERINEFDNVEYDGIDDFKDKTNEVVTFVKNLRINKQSALKRIYKMKEEYREKNKKLAENDFDDVKIVCDAILRKKIDVSTLGLFKEECNIILTITDLLDKYEKMIYELDTIKRKEIIHQSIEKYWNENYGMLIRQIVSLDKPIVENVLLDKAKEIIDNEDVALKELMKKCELQKNLFEKYNRSYSRYMEA